MTLTTDASVFCTWTPLGAARSRIASGLRRFRRRNSERNQMKLLLDCDDRVLKDIGVSRAEVRRRLGRYSD